MFIKLIKAGVPCLFLCFACANVYSQTFQFQANMATAYSHALNLELPKVMTLVGKPSTAEALYIVSLAKTLDILITEDAGSLEKFMEEHRRRLAWASRNDAAVSLFLQAELRVQEAFVALKFGNEFSAAWALRQAYITVQRCKENYPTFAAINKTSGLLEVVFGAVPSRYNWILSLVGVSGSIDNGLRQLQTLAKSDHDLALEADLIYSLIQGFVLQQTKESLNHLKNLQAKHPKSNLLYFLGSILALKNSESETALSMINAIGKSGHTKPFTFSYYLKGEIYLHKALYDSAVSFYAKFLAIHRGLNYKKDALYKTGVCYLLNEQTSGADTFFEKAKNTGTAYSEADKYAQFSMDEGEHLNIPLTKARYYTDGGYYAEAGQILEALNHTDLPSRKDKVEYYYRKARLAHKTGKLKEAQLFYEQVAAMPSDKQWYFAPNALLQLGYLAMNANEKTAARFFFEKALTYKDHVYKNSIESKAKTALAQLNTFK